MEAIDIISYVSKDLREAVDLYKKDLRALPEAALSTSPGGTARSPLDFSYEVIVVNERGAARIKGEDPGPWPYTSWVTAPAEWRNLDKICAGLDRSVESLIEGIGSDPFRKVAMGGEDKAVFQALLFFNMHIMYHAAQLNLIQAMHGDDAMHWME